VRAWRAQATIRRATGPLVANTAGNMTLKAAFEARQNDTDDPIAPKTKVVNEGFWRALLRADPRIGELKLREIDSTYLRRVLQKIKADSMREHVRQMVSSLYTHAEVTPNPAARSRRRRTRASRVASRTAAAHGYLEDGTVERVIAAMPDRYRMLVRLMWRVGLRPGEALALTVGQVDPEAGELTIDRAVSDKVLGDTKTGSVRRPVMAPSVAAALEGHVRRYSDWNDRERLVFTNEDGSMIDLGTWRRRFWKRACRDAGVDADPYDLRHTFCSNAVHAGVDLVSVAEAAGHSVAQLAKTYLHGSREAFGSAALKLDERHDTERFLTQLSISSGSNRTDDPGRSPRRSAGR
jgi:integrase